MLRLFQISPFDMKSDHLMNISGSDYIVLKTVDNTITSISQGSRSPLPAAS